MKAALEKFGFTGCKDADLEPVFTYLEFCLKQVGPNLRMLTPLSWHVFQREKRSPAMIETLSCWRFLPSDKERVRTQPLF